MLLSGFLQLERIYTCVRRGLGQRRPTCKPIGRPVTRPLPVTDDDEAMTVWMREFRPLNFIPFRQTTNSFSGDASGCGCKVGAGYSTSLRWFDWEGCAVNEKKQLDGDS